MKRIFPAVLGVLFLFLGLTLPDTLTDLDYTTLTVYEGGAETVYTADQIPPATRGKTVRVDMIGELGDVLSRLGARELFREEFDGLTVVYAFSPRFSAHETVHGYTVNLMLASRGSTLAVGTPLLKGSY